MLNTNTSLAQQLVRRVVAREGSLERANPRVGLIELRFAAKRTVYDVYELGRRFDEGRRR